MVKILLYIFLFIGVTSVIPNCAYYYQYNNTCVSCYYGFKLTQNRCDSCLDEFIMIGLICVDKQSTTQSVIQVNNDVTTPPIAYNQQQTTGTSQSWQSQGSGNVVSVPSNNGVAQTDQNINVVNYQTNNNQNGASSSNQVTFDISNSGVIYLLQLFGLTSKIPPKCQIFTPQFKCIQCSTGFNLISSSNICSTASSSTSSSTSSSSSTILNTQSSSSVAGNTYSDPNCQASNNGICSQCYYRYYYSSINKKCVVVNVQCLTWDKDGNCLSCYSGYRLNGNNCIQSSSQTSGAQTTSTSGTSTTIAQTSSDPLCKSFGSNGICSQCYYSYYYSTQTGFCVPVNPQCKTWNSLGYCLSCYVGYQILGTTCSVNFSYNQGSSQNNQGSQSNSGNNQNGQTNSNLYGNVFDPNCRSSNNNGSCSLCYASYYYDSINTKKCVAVNPLCRTWNNFGYCLSCYQGYDLISNSCNIQSVFRPNVMVGQNDLPLTDQDPYCNTYKDKVCIKCATRTYYDTISKRCLQVDSNCKSWTQSGICNVCYDGYYIFNQKRCMLMYPEVNSIQLKSQLNTDVNCRASDSKGICTQCIFRFVLNSSTKKCIKVSDQCKTWSQTNALCTACYGGYSLINGECKVSF